MNPDKAAIIINLATTLILAARAATPNYAVLVKLSEAIQSTIVAAEPAPAA